MRSKYGQVQANPTNLIIPSGANLAQQIARAEAKFAESRRKALNERGERIAAMHDRQFRAEREYDARRYVNAGNKP